MSFAFEPWQLLFVILAGWVNRQQQQVIEYLRMENQILKEKLNRRILLDDDQRRRLAIKGKVLGRRVLGQIGTLFTPDTIPPLASVIGGPEMGLHCLPSADSWTTAPLRRGQATGGAVGDGQSALGL
jgi:hypothetical protein